MYNNNPTLENLPTAKVIDQTRQGEVLIGMAPAGERSLLPNAKHFYIESYGCQMNFSDSEIVASILAEAGFTPTRQLSTADLILINTCSIREKAEETVRQRLRVFDQHKAQRPGTLVGVLGCMAERLKAKFLEEEKLVDIVVGPDAYRDLPGLIAGAEDGLKGINVFLSREETYADISPLRLHSNGVTAFISIMRGCDNMCSFCVVPYTRGRERSRNALSIMAEAAELFDRGFREVTLLGQNVDSYKWINPETEQTVTFAQLLVMVAEVSPLLRLRFSTSHPKDITDEVLFAIRDYENICNYIHLPVQSGNSRILALMNRTYDRAWYQAKVDRIREIIPDCALSSDVITGFCSETEEEHQDTLSMMDYAKYSMAYMFYYSERPGTPAARKLVDDVPLDIKKRRLQEIVDRQNALSRTDNLADVGKIFRVLIEGDSKKSTSDWKGRNSQNKMLVFPKQGNFQPGNYVNVKVLDANSATLLGEMLP
ncbi:MAG: tRNA (N6-isopentenyl adenosine(37)-C2)-methylthiotransferase MiaB [Lewinella sp.]|nr:tRNA (N6-isopentenyl adenosine(37)-C2)-methylthiotransferase MiaB [Lewinella sp.]